MKKILLLLLLSSIICEKTNIIGEIQHMFKCLSNSKFFIEDLNQIIEALKSKDMDKIIKIGLSLFNKFIEEIRQCNNNLRKLNEEIEDEDIKLGYPKEVYVLYSLIGKRAFEWYDIDGLKSLRDNCFSHFGQSEWFCQYLNK